MTTSPKYTEYINPTIDPYSPQKENPLVLMAQVCSNIGKELQSSSKQRKSNSPPESKRSLKRLVSTQNSPSTLSKKTSLPQSSYFPSSSLIFDSLYFHHLNKTFDLSLFPTLPLNYSNLSPSSFQRSSYLMDSILSSPFVCNWMDSTIQDGFCGKRFTNHLHLLEHLCTEHTFHYSSTSIEQL